MLTTRFDTFSGLEAALSMDGQFHPLHASPRPRAPDFHPAPETADYKLVPGREETWSRGSGPRLWSQPFIYPNPGPPIVSRVTLDFHFSALRRPHHAVVWGADLR